MKKTQAQKQNVKNAEEKKEAKIAKIHILDAKQLPKFGVLMQTEY